MYTFDHELFLALNFDGGPVVDRIMVLCSTPAAWAWLYILMLWLVWRRGGWRALLLFAAAAAAALGLADVVAGIFKHSGLLGGLWPSFPARLRPMHTPELEGLARRRALRHRLGACRHDDGAVRHGHSRCAAAVVLGADTRRDRRNMLFAHIPRLPLSSRHSAGGRRGAVVGSGGAAGGGGRSAEGVPQRCDGLRRCSGAMNRRGARLMVAKGRIIVPEMGRGFDFLPRKLFFRRLLTKFEKCDL